MEITRTEHSHEENVELMRRIDFLVRKVQCPKERTNERRSWRPHWSKHEGSSRSCCMID